MMSTLITTLGAGIALLMGIGAVFGAVNTMYSAVAARTREIATLRALGFGGGPVVVSVLVESLLLALVGGVIGGGAGLRRVQRLPDVDDQLADVQPGGVRLRGDAGADRRRDRVRAGDGPARRPAAGHPRGAAAHRGGAAGAVAVSNGAGKGIGRVREWRGRLARSPTGWRPGLRAEIPGSTGCGRCRTSACTWPASP